jgi:hypothetical protein
MGGLGQHYVPRLLMRGFAAKRTGGDHLVWMFPKTGAPRLESVDDVLALPAFYDDGAPTGADARLTTAERELARIVRTVRERRTLKGIEPKRLALHIGLLVARTRNLRDGFAAAGKLLVDKLCDQFAKPETAQSLMKLFDEKPEEFVEWLAKHGKSQHLIPLLRIALLNPVLRAHLRPGVARVVGEIASKVRAVQAQLDVHTLERAAREGQARALVGLDGHARTVTGLASLRWRVWSTNGEAFILSDLLVLYRGADGEYSSPWAESEVTNRTVVVPVSATVALVGGAVNEPQDWDADRYNLAAAEFSRECFIASRRTEYEERLLARLGRKADLMTSQRLDQIADQGMRGLLPPS